MAEILQSGTKDDEPGVIIYALGPWKGPLHGGMRLPPIFRIRFANRKFYLENKHGTGNFGRWKAMGECAQFTPLLDKMQEFNAAELAKYRLSAWPSQAEIAAELLKFGIGVE